MDHEPNASSTSGSKAPPAFPLRRRPIPRKGHKKSRAGCLICKRRKVKCDESAPRCGPCDRLGLECRYSDSLDSADRQPSDKTIVLGKPLRSHPTQFKIEDLRFFQHFLFSAYPSLPIGGWDVWQAVGRMSHDYDFLVHAMLGLGASHLGLLDNRRYTGQALKHRVLAIQSLNQHLAKDDLTLADGDAAFAAMLSLTFQSAYLPDGMVDFFSMIRGCFVIGLNVIKDFESSTFKTFGRDDYVERIQKLFRVESSERSLDKAIAAGFCASLKRLGPLCRSVPEIEYLSKMQRIATYASATPADLAGREECYYEHSFLYDRMGMMSPEEFTSFVDPKNHVSQLIIMHLLVLEFVMGRKEMEYGDKLRMKNDRYQEVYDCRKIMSLEWIKKMMADLPEGYRSYAAWLAQFTRGLSISFNSEEKLWKPFLLHDGTTTVTEVEDTETMGRDEDQFQQELCYPMFDNSIK